jgi:putative oxidoreductase
MTRLFARFAAAHAALERSGDWLLPGLARFAFAATLLGYFWASALTKPGSGLFGVLHPNLNAYVQIFPHATEAAGFSLSGLTAFHWAVVTAGTLAEFILPLLITLGLATRLAALGMIGFVALQTLTDIYGHGADATAIGAWFDRVPDSPILDQRLYWLVLFVVMIVKGAGPVSLDALFARAVPLLSADRA